MMQYYDSDGFPVESNEIKSNVQYYDADGFPVELPVETPIVTPEVKQKKQGLAEALLSATGPKPFQYTFNSNGVKFTGEFAKKLTDAELNAIAKYLDLDNGFTYETNISANPDVIAQYLAQTGASDAEIAQAYSAPRAVRNKLLNPEATGKIALSYAGDALSGAGRVTAASLGELGDFVSGKNSEDFGSRLSRVGSRPDQGFVSGTLEEIVRDPMLLPSIPMGMGATKLAKFVPGVRGYAATEGTMKFLKPAVVGSGLGIADVAGRDVFNDYTLDQDKVTGTDYAIGAGLGALTPAAVNFAEDFAPRIRQGIDEFLPNQPQYRERTVLDLDKGYKVPNISDVLPGQGAQQFEDIVQQRSPLKAIFGSGEPSAASTAEFVQSQLLPSSPRIPEVTPQVQKAGRFESLADVLYETGYAPIKAVGEPIINIPKSVLNELLGLRMLGYEGSKGIKSGLKQVVPNLPKALSASLPAKGTTVAEEINDYYFTPKEPKPMTLQDYINSALKNK